MKGEGGWVESGKEEDSRVDAGKQETSEGVFYIWTTHGVENVLNKQDAAVFEYAYGVESGGNVPAHQDIRGEMSGKNVLYEAHSTDETAKKFGLTVEQTAERLTAGRKVLFEARSHRPQPPLEDKIVTAWDGLMISALARASPALGEPRYLQSAQPPTMFPATHPYDSQTVTLFPRR